MVGVKYDEALTREEDIYFRHKKNPQGYMGSEKQKLTRLYQSCYATVYAENEVKLKFLIKINNMADSSHL